MNFLPILVLLAIAFFALLFDVVLPITRENARLAREAKEAEENAE